MEKTDIEDLDAMIVELKRQFAHVIFDVNNTSEDKLKNMQGVLQDIDAENFKYEDFADILENSYIGKELIDKITELNQIIYDMSYLIRERNRKR